MYRYVNTCIQCLVIIMSDQLTDSLKYANLPSRQVAGKCKEIENSNLSREDKIDELKRIAIGQVYDIAGASYDLHYPDSLIVYARCWNILKMRKIHSYTLYEPQNDKTLPKIIITHDSGRIIDYYDAYDSD